MFDEEPDRDPHGECRAEIARLTAELAAARKELDAVAEAGIKRGRSWEATEWEAAFGARNRREAVAKLRDAEDALAAARAVPAPLARPLSEWHEDHGDVLWWRFPIDEPPYCGSPITDDWPGDHTHWTPIVCPDDPNQRGPLPKGG